MSIIDIFVTASGSFMGVGFGYIFSQLNERRKKKDRQEQIRQAVSRELEVVRNILGSAKKNGEVYQVCQESFPFICDSFDCLKVELAASLKPEKLETVNKAYMRIRELNNKRESGFLRGYVLVKDSNCPFCYTHNVDEDIKVINAAIGSLNSDR